MLDLSMPLAVFIGPPGATAELSPTEPAHRVGAGPAPAEREPALVPACARARRRWRALVLRVAYVFVARRNFDPHGDAYFYHAGANLLADGKGFISPFFEQLGHPPRPRPSIRRSYIVFLAIPSVLGMKSVLTHLLWSCVLGTATVWVIGLLGRAVGGARVGIVAAVDRGGVPEPLGTRRHAAGRDPVDVLRGRWPRAARVPLLAGAELAPARARRRSRAAWVRWRVRS